MLQSNATELAPGYRRLARRLALGIALSGLLASCDDDYGGRGCSSCGTVTPFETSAGVVSADFNGDGFADVVAASSVHPEVAAGSSNLKAYLSTAAGVFAAPTLTAAGDDPLYLASADLNGDGFMDLVSASFDDGALRVFFNDKASPGVFNAPLVLGSPGASQVAIADMNADGLPDLISADFTVSLFVQTSPGTFAAPLALYSGGANWVAVGDLNGDGAPDVALTDGVGVKVLMHTGAASATTYAAPATVFTQTANLNVAGANIIAIADVNGDGLNDLVAFFLIWPAGILSAPYDSALTASNGHRIGRTLAKPARMNEAPARISADRNVSLADLRLFPGRFRCTREAKFMPTGMAILCAT